MTVAGIEKVIPALGIEKMLDEGVPQATLDRVAPGVKPRMSASAWRAGPRDSRFGKVSSKTPTSALLRGSTRSARAVLGARRPGFRCASSMARFIRSAEGRRRAAAVLRISVSGRGAAPLAVLRRPELISVRLKHDQDQQPPLRVARTGLFPRPASRLLTARSQSQYCWAAGSSASNWEEVMNLYDELLVASQLVLSRCRVSTPRRQAESLLDQRIETLDATAQAAYLPTAGKAVEAPMVELYAPRADGLFNRRGLCSQERGHRRMGQPRRRSSIL